VDLDDFSYVVHNPHVTDGLTVDNVVWAFTTRHRNFWIPLTWLSLQLDATFTPAPSPATNGEMTPVPPAMAFHLSNVIYHAAGTCLLFLFLRRATGRTYASFLAALLWAVHPLRVESVAWVTERKDVLSGLFGFLALYLYIVWAQRQTLGLWLACGVAATASLMAKPMTLALPFVFLLLDYWPLRRLTSAKDLGRLVLEKLPLFIIVALCGAATTYMQRNVSRPPIGPAGYFPHAVAGYGRYLWQHLDFHSLVPFYPYAPPPIWLVACSGTAVLAITALAICWRRVRPAFLVGWLWFLGTILPFVGLFNSGDQATADRFTYFPAVGLAVLVIFSLPPAWFDRPRRTQTLVLGGALALVLAAGTFSLAGYWEKSITLFERTVALAGENPTSLKSLGYAYLHARRYDDAISVLQRVGRHDSRDTVAENGIATAYLLKRQPADAITILRIALAKRDEDPETHMNLGVALMQAHQWDEAVEQFEFLLRLNPQNTQARAALEQAREGRGF
jgi:tetratricopeptide (TPR) repeat protein